MTAADAKNLSFSYYCGRTPLKDVSITVQKGEFAAILGRNGCGKSTLVKHFNALLEVQKGTLTVNGLDAADEKNVYALRQSCGMVFQNPDNQFVSGIVEEDVAFGLLNYDVPDDEIDARVHDALSAVGMAGYEKRAPHSLSGGQKQRVALAGVLAMQPETVVFDEATSMLDPQGRAEVLEAMHALHRSGKTVIMISHNIEEAVDADSVYIVSDGGILAHGTPREILTDIPLLEKAGLCAPMPVRMYYSLAENGVRLARCPLTCEELAEEICRLN